MKKIFIITISFFIINVLFLSCNKVCTCGFYQNDVLVSSESEIAKYEKDCVDQSDDQEMIIVFIDSIAAPILIPDTLPIFKCK